MYAAYCANLKVILLLLEEGAQTGLKNYEGHTALILASKCGSSDVVSLLINVIVMNYLLLFMFINFKLILQLFKRFFFFMVRVFGTMVNTFNQTLKKIKTILHCLYHV